MTEASPRKPVALVCMPTLSGRFPSFQLGLLGPTLERAGIPVEPHSLYMHFGAHVGWRLHEALAEVWPCLVGEWLWARAAFGDFADDDAYFAAYPEAFRQVCEQGGCTIADIRQVRDEVVPAFLDLCVGSVDWGKYSLVGFTVLFQQQLATLALAREIKRRHPHVPIILGGGTFEDDIALEILRSCPQVDLVHCGDADETLPEIVRRLEAGEPLAGVRGVMRRDPDPAGGGGGGGGGTRILFEGRAENLADLDRTPVPDYDEYFRARAESGYAAWPWAERPLLPIETARGCWWGMKSHCTFCGLNRAGMDFRAKEVRNVLAMLDALARRYGVLSYNAIDNIIAPSYVEKLFGALAAARADFKIHYEIKANLTREQLGRMKQGGLYSVQPGVESLSTNVLRLMKKGTTAVRNLELIKWCTYFGIDNLYNILLGFAGETADDYRQQVELIERVPHYQPPYSICRARPDRGSPMYTAPEAHGIRALRPEPCYRYLFPPDRFDLRRISYYCEDDREGTLGEAGYEPIRAAVARWRERWLAGPESRPFLRYEKLLDAIVTWDGRRDGEVRRFAYEGREARLYELCGDAHGRDAIDRAFGPEAAGPWIDAALEAFIANDLLVHLDGRYLALALPENPWHGFPAREAAAAAAAPAAPVKRALPVVA